MPLDKETLNHLRNVKENIEEILSEIGDIVPPDFRVTCVLRYCGDNPDVQDMIWTDDVHYDVINSLTKHGESE